MPTKTWKKNELSFKSIGAHRNHFEAEDCSHPIFSIECKHRSIQNYPKTLRSWFEQARSNAADGKIPLLSIHLANEIRGNDLIVMRRSDFEDLLGKIGGGPTTGIGGMFPVVGHREDIAAEEVPGVGSGTDRST